MTDPGATVELLRHVSAEFPLAAYPSAGNPRGHEGRLFYPTTPAGFAQATRELVANGARLIGGCCGTTPVYVAALASAIAKLSPVP